MNNSKRIARLDIKTTLFLIFLPIVNGLSQFLATFFDPKYGLIDSSIHIGLYRAVITLGLYVLFFIFYRKTDKLSNILIQIGFLVLLSCLWSVDIEYSFNTALKFFFWITAFSVGYSFIYSWHHLKVYFHVYIIIHFLIIISVLIMNILHIGVGIYKTGYRAGAGGVSVVIQLVPLVFFLPFYLKISSSKFFKALASFLLISSLAYIIISTKRGALLGLIVGFLTYSHYTPYKKIFRKSFVVISVVAFFILLIFSELLFNVYESRVNRFDLTKTENLEEEARFYELEYVFNDFLNQPANYIIGYGFFSESAPNASFYEYSRQHHIDYISLFYGTGIIGLSFFLYHLYYFIRSSKRYIKTAQTLLDKELASILYGAIIAFSIMSVSSTITQVDYRFYAYLMFGGFFRILLEIRKGNIKVI